MKKILEKFNFLFEYNPSKGGLLEQEPSTKYICLNECKSWGGAMSGGALEKAIQRTDENTILVLSEAIDYEFTQNEKGGIIVFSTDVNGIKLHEAKWINKIKQFFLTWKQRFTSIEKINKITKKYNLPAFSIGKFFKGVYTDKMGNIYSENSISLEVIGVNFNELIKISEDLCADFLQETVLVKSYVDNRILLVNPN